MLITDEARDMLKQVFEENGTHNIRVYFGGYG